MQLCTNQPCRLCDLPALIYSSIGLIPKTNSFIFRLSFILQICPNSCYLHYSRICNTYFTVFFKIKKHVLRFLEMTCQKHRKRYRSFKMINLLTFRNTLWNKCIYTVSHKKTSVISRSLVKHSLILIFGRNIPEKIRLEVVNGHLICTTWGNKKV